MSDHIPLDIQSEIIKRLPVKYVIQCRSVSKSLKSVIDSPKFIANYHQQQQHQHHHLFVKYNLSNSSDEQKYFSIVDNDTFPNQKSSLTVPLSVTVALLYKTTLTSVNGLLCFHLDPEPLGVTEYSLAFLWNPTIQKLVRIHISNSLIPPTGLTHILFGVCPNTSDPKLVRINACYLKVNNGKKEEVEVGTVNNWEVEVFMLSTRVWKSVSNIPSAFKTCNLMPRHVCIDGFIYMLAYDTIAEAGTYLIILFDLKSDEFGEVCLPDRLVDAAILEVSKVYESLGLFHHYSEGMTDFCDVWIMKEGVSKSFTKMLSIQVPDNWGRCRVLELRKNGGEAIIQRTDNKDWSVLEVYDTSTGSISCMGINGSPFFFLVNSCMETLLLLDVKFEDDDKV